MSKSQILNVLNMSFNAIRENKLLTKISEFTVCWFCDSILPVEDGLS